MLCFAIVPLAVASESAENATVLMPIPAKFCAGFLEGGKLGVAIRAPVTAIDKHDAERTCQRVWQFDAAAPGSW